MNSQFRLLGVAWYTQEHYDQCRAMFVDGEVLPASYMDWKNQVERFRERCISQGIGVIQAYIDPNVFPDWCVANGCNADVDGRDTFASDLAGRVMMERSRQRD